jgi:hypothetical protein
VKLDDYQWSRNPRGMHNGNSTQLMNLNDLRAMQMGWTKIVAITELYTGQVGEMIAAGMTPIVRPWQERLGNQPASGRMMQLYQYYFSAGVRWFEFYNEPNLGAEWPDGFFADYRDTAGVIAPLMNNWLDWAEMMLSWGAYPGFPSLAESSQPVDSAVRWLDAMLSYLRDNHLERFRKILDSGGWCATHGYSFNHFYQAVPGNPRQPRTGGINGTEGGWHFEYPYDPLSQADDPGRTVYGGTGRTPYGDPNGIMAMGLMFMERIQEWFGAGVVPVVSTEGGIYPIPNDGPLQQDTRYPPYDLYVHGEATVAMFNWIASEAPPWYFGMCLWKEDEYLGAPSGKLPAVTRLAATPAPRKGVPALDVLGEAPPPRDYRGPGPIHGTPDYHFVLIGPGISPDWFFARGRAYWERFRPSIVTDAAFIPNIPYKKSLGLTLLAAPGEAEKLAGALREKFPPVWVDVIPAQDGDGLAAVLDARAESGRRFG